LRVLACRDPRVPFTRDWLRRALPRALAPIQPGGGEFEAARGSASGMLALDIVSGYWPWQVDTGDLFDADPERRRRSTESVAREVLTPRGDIADLLPRAMRETAAFVFVYGAG
jgi:hypothetical protein